MLRFHLVKDNLRLIFYNCACYCHTETGFEPITLEHESNELTLTLPRYKFNILLARFEPALMSRKNTVLTN